MRPAPVPATPRRRRRAPTVAALAVALTVLSSRRRQPLTSRTHPPGRPVYDASEESFPTCQVAVTSEQYYLVLVHAGVRAAGHRPRGRVGELDRLRPGGTSTIGRPDVVIAYVEGGVNWHEGGDAAGSSTSTRRCTSTGVSCPRRPPPTASSNNGDPGSTRSTRPDTEDANDNGIIDAEDLIVRFSDGVDDDGNGYVDDISGWDFYGDQNYPAWTDDAYEARQRPDASGGGDDRQRHPRGPRSARLLASAGQGRRRGARPYRRPRRRRGSTRPTPGADAIVSVTADLGYSSFMEDAIEEHRLARHRDGSRRPTTSTARTTRAASSNPTSCRATRVVANSARRRERRGAPTSRRRPHRSPGRASPRGAPENVVSRRHPGRHHLRGDPDDRWDRRASWPWSRDAAEAGASSTRRSTPGARGGAPRRDREPTSTIRPMSWPEPARVGP